MQEGEQTELGKCACGCGEIVAEGKRFVHGHHLRKGVRTVEQPVAKEESFIEECAEEVAKWIGGRDPDWGKRIEILMTDKGFSYRQALGSMCGYVLDRSLHLELPSHPYFEPGAHPFQEKICEWPPCGKTFAPKVPGQRFHDNSCGTAFLKNKEKEESAATKPAPRQPRDIARTA